MTEAEKKLVEDNLALVHHVIREKFPSLPGDRADWVQTGMLGLCSAAVKYTPERGRFAGFACKCIQNAILIQLRHDRCQTRRTEASTISLNAKVDEDNGLFKELVGDPAQNVEASVLAREKLRKIYALAGDRQQVLKAATGEIYQREAAASLGLSQSYVSRIINKIRHIMKEEETADDQD